MEQRCETGRMNQVLISSLRLRPLTLEPSLEIEDNALQEGRCSRDDAIRPRRGCCVSPRGNEGASRVRLYKSYVLGRML